MNPQLSIFDPAVGSGSFRIIQKGAANQRIYDANLNLFRGQALLVYKLLKQGRRLTTTEALKLGIGDLRARVYTLRKAGIDVKDQLIEGRYKEFYL